MLFPTGTNQAASSAQAESYKLNTTEASKLWGMLAKVVRKALAALKNTMGLFGALQGIWKQPWNPSEQ